MKEAILCIVVVLVGVCVQSGESIRCWECNSKYDPHCGIPFKNHTIALADCTQRYLHQNIELEASICRKITQKVRGETRIIRGCGFFNPEDAGNCITRAGTHMVFMHYCQCNRDGCNDSERLFANIGAMITALIATALLSILN